MNEELIATLRYCFEKRKMVAGVPLHVWCDRAADALEAADKRIEEFETALAACRARREQLPKRGEWIGVNPMVDTEQCSLCGWNIPTYEFETNYCPNCGAKMRGERQ